MLYPQRFVALAVILLATFLSVGFVHGLWTDRWVSKTASHEALVAEMEKVPLNIGKWEGQTVQDNPDYRPIDDANSYVVRRYINKADGSGASVMITRGRSGPLVIKHLPTECYPSSGYELVGEPTS